MTNSNVLWRVCFGIKTQGSGRGNLSHYTRRFNFYAEPDIEKAKLKAEALFSEKYTGKDSHGEKYSDYKIENIHRVEIL